MKVESNIRIGQLVRIKNSVNPDLRRELYLVVSKRGNNCELIPVNNKRINQRRWWDAQGLSVYV